MMRYAYDTTQEAHDFLMRLIRNSTAQQRIERLLKIGRIANGLALSGMIDRNPNTPINELKAAIAKRGDRMIENLDEIGKIVKILNEIPIPYAIVGSVASSRHGRERTTGDMDIIALLNHINVSAFISALTALGNDWYFDAQSIHNAIARKSSFNLIHITQDKVDIFVRAKGDDIELRRAEAHQIAPDLSAYFATAEDTILGKLDWHKMSQSERQLRDVVGIVEVQGDRLDTEYIKKQASQRGTLHLWQQVIS